MVKNSSSFSHDISRMKAKAEELYILFILHSLYQLFMEC